MAQMVKNLPAMQETQVRSVGREDPLEESMSTHSNILAWRIPRTEEPGLNIRKFMVHILLKPGLANFEHYFTSM